MDKILRRWSRRISFFLYLVSFFSVSSFPFPALSLSFFFLVSLCAVNFLSQFLSLCFLTSIFFINSFHPLTLVSSIHWYTPGLFISLSLPPSLPLFLSWYFSGFPISFTFSCYFCLFLTLPLFNPSVSLLFFLFRLMNVLSLPWTLAHFLRFYWRMR